jgi:hypothetical protein
MIGAKAPFSFLGIQYPRGPHFLDIYSASLVSFHGEAGEEFVNIGVLHKYGPGWQPRVAKPLLQSRAKCLVESNISPAITLIRLYSPVWSCLPEDMHCRKCTRLYLAPCLISTAQEDRAGGSKALTARRNQPPPTGALPRPC